MQSLPCLTGIQDYSRGVNFIDVVVGKVIQQQCNFQCVMEVKGLDPLSSEVEDRKRETKMRYMLFQKHASKFKMCKTTTKYLFLY